MPERKKEEEKKPEVQAPANVSRRNFLYGAGIGVAGLAVGGVAGSQVFPKQTPEAVVPVPAQWVSREFTSCTGCRKCEVACSQIKESGKTWPATARVAVREYPPGIEFPVLCYQCGAGAKCVETCPVQAITLNAADSTVRYDLTKCLRTAKNGDCTVCADNCPGSAITFHPVSRAPLSCDLCNGDPACVKVCPSGTITLNGSKAAAIKPDAVAATVQNLYKVGVQKA